MGSINGMGSAVSGTEDPGRTDILIPRFTFEGWKAVSQRRDRGGYEAEQCPDNCMEYLASILRGAKEGFKEGCFRQVLINSGRAEAYSSGAGLIQTVEDDGGGTVDLKKEEKLIAEAGLDISSWDYFLCAAAFLEKGEKNARLRKPTVEKLKGFFCSTAGIDGSEIFIGGFAMTPAKALSERDRIANITDVWFREGKEVRYGGYNTINADSDWCATLLCVPLTVRETHKDNAIPVDEVIEYCEAEDTGSFPAKGTAHTLRYLWTKQISGEEGLLSPHAISESEGGRMLAEDLSRMGNGGKVSGPFLLPAELLGSCCGELARHLKKAGRRAGVKFIVS